MAEGINTSLFYASVPYNGHIYNNGGKFIMEEQQPKQPTTEGTEENGAAEYINAINNLKATTVPKTEFEKLQQEKSELLKALVEGKQLPQQETEPKHRPIDEIRKDLFEKDNSNLEYARKTLELRDAVLAETGEDVFLPNGHRIAATEEDIVRADNLATVLRHCVDYAEGDSSLFTQELQRVTVDTSRNVRR